MSAPRTVSPEMAEDARYRYEETDEPVPRIAADCAMSERTFYKFIKRHGWRLRIHRPPRELPADLHLTRNVDRALKEAEAVAGPNPAPTVIGVSVGRGAACRAPTHIGGPPGSTPAAGSQPASAETGDAPDIASIADRLESEMEAVLARVERLRAEPWAEPAADAANLTRTLERLTEALIKVRRLRSLDMPTGRADDFDDMPKDIDERRLALAERIEAFVRSRTDQDLPAAGETADCG